MMIDEGKGRAARSYRSSHHFRDDLVQTQHEIRVLCGGHALGRAHEKPMSQARADPYDR